MGKSIFTDQFESYIQQVNFFLIYLILVKELKEVCVGIIDFGKLRK